MDISNTTWTLVRNVPATLLVQNTGDTLIAIYPAATAGGQDPNTLGILPTDNGNFWILDFMTPLIDFGNKFSTKNVWARSLGPKVGKLAVQYT
jgi:hypothetical protein